MTVQGQEREIDLGPKIGTYLHIYNIISNAYLCAIVPSVFNIYTIYIMSICLNPESDICEHFGGRQVENSRLRQKNGPPQSYVNYMVTCSNELLPLLFNMNTLVSLSLTHTNSFCVGILEQSLVTKRRAYIVFCFS